MKDAENGLKLQCFLSLRKFHFNAMSFFEIHRAACIMFFVVFFFGLFFFVLCQPGDVLRERRDFECFKEGYKLIKEWEKTPPC